MNEIQSKRASLMSALETLEKNTRQLQLDQIEALASNAQVSEAARLFVQTRDELFLRVRQRLNELNHDEMEELEWRLRDYSLGLRKLTSAVQNGWAIAQGTVEFYHDLRDYIELSEELSRFKKFEIWMKENPGTAIAIGVCATVVSTGAAVAALFFGK